MTHNLPDRFIPRACVFALAMAAPATPLFFGQTAPTPKFDVVSIRQNNTGTKFFHSRFTSDGLSAENISVLMLMRQAWNMMNSLDDKFIGVPEWARTERYTIEARIDPSTLDEFHTLTPATRGVMIKALLEDRFHLKTHPETREQPVYALVIAKSGPKLKAATPGDAYAKSLDDGHGGRGPGAVNLTHGHLQAQAIPVSELKVMLTQATGRTVLDETGLAGKYDIALTWTPEDNQAPTPSDNAPADSTGPSIFTALQEQLGLRLEPAKAPVEVLVIDHIERPTEN